MDRIKIICPKFLLKLILEKKIHKIMTDHFDIISFLVHKIFLE